MCCFCTFAETEIMKIYTNYSIKHWNTFGIDVMTKQAVVLEHNDDFLAFIGMKMRFPDPCVVIGGGSNMLFCNNFDGTLIHVENKGYTIVEENDEVVILEVAAGEPWESFIDFCLERNYGGVENLTLIPGQVGSAPVQNIGAYGVEVADVIDSVEALSLADGTVHRFNKEACGFTYRYSIFKGPEKGKYLIRSVRFQLNKKPVLNVLYGSVATALSASNNLHPGIKDVAMAIRGIRTQKLPDPENIGNAGSFFKNPVIANEAFTVLQEQYPDIPGYKVGDSHTKVAAGWLIENAGWKGFRDGEVGVYEKQALVLVNYGSATGMDILKLSEKIQASIMKKYGIQLQREVQVITS